MKYSRRIKIATLRYENVSILAKLLIHFDQINPNVAGLISDPKTRNMFSNVDLRLLLGNTARFKLFMFGASLEGLKMGAFPKMPRLYDFSEIQNYKKKNYLRYGDLVVEEFGEKASQVESEIYSIDIPKSFTKDSSLSLDLVGIPNVAFLSGIGQFSPNLNVDILSENGDLSSTTEKYPKLVYKDDPYKHSRWKKIYGRDDMLIRAGDGVDLAAHQSLYPLKGDSDFGIDPKTYDSWGAYVESGEYLLTEGILLPMYLEYGIDVMQTQVSNGLFKNVMGYVNSVRDGDTLPTTGVSWFEAIEFCNALSILLGYDEIYEIDKKQGKVIWNKSKIGFRLPTSLEWECAARAGTPNIWLNTSTKNQVCIYTVNAKYFQQNRISENMQPIDVIPNYKSYIRPNDWGFYHLGGNVSEWCHDAYKDNETLNRHRKRFIGATEQGYSFFDQNFSETGNWSNNFNLFVRDALVSTDVLDRDWSGDLYAERMVKGGHFASNLVDCAIGRVQYTNPNFASDMVGFRVVLQKKREIRNNVFDLRRIYKLTRNTQVLSSF